MKTDYKNDLIARYIYAVTRRLPSKQKDDVASELETVISDMLAERCGDVQPEEKDVRVVLTELGTPNELAEKYSTDKVNCLIGSPHYMTYKNVVTIVIAAAAFGVAISMILSQIVEPSGPWYSIIGELLAAIWSTALQAFAIVTLIFAIMHRKGVSIDGTRSLDDLPSVPTKKEKISRVDCCVSIALTVILTALVIFAPQIITGYAHIDGKTVTSMPLFDLDILASTVPLLVATAVIGIGRDIVMLIEGRYSKLAAFVIAGANTVLIILFSMWLSHDGLFNTELNHYLAEIDGMSEVPLQSLSMSLQYLLLAALIIGHAISAVKAVVIALKTSR